MMAALLSVFAAALEINSVLYGHRSNCSLYRICSIRHDTRRPNVHIQRSLTPNTVVQNNRNEVRYIRKSSQTTHLIVLKQQYKLAKHQSTSVYLKIRMGVCQQRSNIIIVVCFKCFSYVWYSIDCYSGLRWRVYNFQIIIWCGYEPINFRIQRVHYDTCIIITLKDGGCWKRGKRSRRSWPNASVGIF